MLNGTKSLSAGNYFLFMRFCSFLFFFAALTDLGNKASVQKMTLFIRRHFVPEVKKMFFVN